jgi:hypothetical protein
MKTLPQNVTPFLLDGLWPLDALDQPTMAWLRRVADQKDLTVAELLYDAIEEQMAKHEAEKELEMKIIRFPVRLL